MRRTAFLVLGSGVVTFALLTGQALSVSAAWARPAWDKATPAVVNVTPAAPSVTPALVSVTPAAGNATPASVSVTPTASGVTPAAGNMTPTQPTPTPGAAGGTPAPTSSTPAPTSMAPTLPAASDATSGGTQSLVPDGPADPFRDREDRLALAVGRARMAAGLLPLARSSSLDRAAVAHAQDMAALGYMEHEAPDGSTPGLRAAREGYDTTPGSAWMVVETISAISDDPDAALGWWLSDGLHQRVVLRSGWRELGMGFAAGGPYGRFWVALFGCRPSVLPPVLLDGILAVPDELCGRSADAFGPVDSVRIGETSAAAHSKDWEAYAAELPWPTGHSAVVDLRDAAGHELETRAADPTGALTQVP